MNRAELITAVAERADLSKKDVASTLGALEQIVAEQLNAGQKVTLTGFGTFEVRERAAREGRVPRTGETITIAASRNPVFKAGKAFKDAIK